MKPKVGAGRAVPAKCKNCNHWDSSDDPKKETGMCTRFPPQMIYHPGEEQIMMIRPAVYWDEWCGEFEIRSDA